MMILDILSCSPSIALTLVSTSSMPKKFTPLAEFSNAYGVATLLSVRFDYGRNCGGNVMPHLKSSTIKNSRLHFVDYYFVVLDVKL